MPSEIAWFGAGFVAGLFSMVTLRQMPFLWHWLKYKVWYDLRYAQGYRKGLADGRTIARGDDGE